MDDEIKSQAAALIADAEIKRGAEYVEISDVHLHGIPYSRQHLYKLIRRKHFPKPIKLCGRIVWRAEDLRAWIKSKAGKK